MFNARSYLLTILLGLLTIGANAADLALNVETFGAVADGHTDSAPAIRKAIASLHQGQTLQFPCTAGSYYSLSTPLDFGKLKYMSIEGSGPGCMLDYKGSSSQPYAFSFVGAFVIDVRNIVFNSSGSGVAPQTVLLLGRTGSSAMSGGFNFNTVRVEGYASKALVYSIASEENTWFETGLYLNGGGALYTFYTSDSDDLGVANLPSASNLSVWMQNFHINDYSPNTDPTHALVYDRGKDSATGNHTYRDGYMSVNNGTAFQFHVAGGAAWMGLTVDSNRFENGAQMFYFSGPGHIGDVSLTNNKSAGVNKYMINMPTTCYNCNIHSNMVQQGDPAISSFGVLRSSYISENHPMTIGQAIASTVINKMQGTLQLTSMAGNTCGVANEGTLRYLPGGAGGSDGLFQICQKRSGAFGWVTH